MKNVLVLYYSSYGHIETMANSVAEGAAQFDGIDVDIKRVPELVPTDIAKQANFKLNQSSEIARPSDLVNYDAIIFGTPTRFGNMAAQMRNFLDQTGGLWFEGKLIGKIASVFTSTGTGGGRETTITSFWHTLAHHGMLISGLPYSSHELTNIDEVHGASPYGAGTIAGADGSRNPSKLELKLAFEQGEHIARLVSRLS